MIQGVGVIVGLILIGLAIWVSSRMPGEIQVVQQMFCGNCKYSKLEEGGGLYCHDSTGSFYLWRMDMYVSCSHWEVMDEKQ